MIQRNLPKRDKVAVVQVNLPKRDEVAVVQIFYVNDPPGVAPPSNLLTLYDFNDCAGKKQYIINKKC